MGRQNSRSGPGPLSPLDYRQTSGDRDENPLLLTASVTRQRQVEVILLTLAGLGQVEVIPLTLAALAL